MGDLVLALLLLTSPESEEPREYGPIVAYNITRLASELDLIDEREMYYFELHHKNYYNSTFIELRQRFHNLKDAPPISDMYRFPSKQIAQDNIDLNRNFAIHVWSMVDQTRSSKNEHYREIISECKRLEEFWELMDEVQRPYLYKPTRRESMKRIRQLIGEEAYYYGRFPSPVPLWRFREIK